MKGLVLAMGVYTTLLWRGFASTILSGAIYCGRRQTWRWPAAMRLHVIRGFVWVAMSSLFFWGIARVPLAQAIALTFIAPSITLFLAAAILKEKIGRATIMASAIAFAGVLVIMFGNAHADLGPDVLPGMLAVLASAICFAFNIILVRAQAQIAGPVEITFWQNVIVTTCLALAAPWLAEVPDIRHAPMILVAAAMALMSHLMVGWAYRHCEASYLVSTEYTAFVWASLFGWLLFAETLSIWTIAGAALIVGGCLAASRRDPPAVSNIEAAL